MLQNANTNWLFHVKKNWLHFTYAKRYEIETINESFDSCSYDFCFLFIRFYALNQSILNKLAEAMAIYCGDM